MVFTCSICHKIFNTENNLNTHINKAIKCNEFIYCKICNKKFNTNYDLTRHTNKKNTCVSKDIQYTNTSTRDLEIILAIEKQKTLREITAENLFRLKAKTKIENSLIKIDAQLKADKEIEQIKTARKILTQSTITNNYITNKISYITNIYINNNIVSNTYTKVINNITEDIKYVLGKEEAVDIYNNSKTITQINNKFIAGFLKNPIMPQNNCIYYFKDTDAFYGTIHDINNKLVIAQLNYLTDIHPKLSIFLQRCYRIIINAVDEILHWPGNMNEADKFVKYHTMRDTLPQISETGIVKSVKDLNWQELQLSCKLYFLIK